MNQESVDFLNSLDNAIVGSDCYLLAIQDKIDWPIVFLSEKLARRLNDFKEGEPRSAQKLLGNQAFALLDAALNEIRWERSGFTTCSVPVTDIDGDVCWFRCVIKRYDGGHGDTYLLFLQNFTSFQRMVGELRLKEARNHQAKSGANFGIWSTKVGSGIMEACDQTYEIYALNAESGPLTYDAFVSGLTHEDKKNIDTAFIATLNDRKSARIEHAYTCLNGEKKFLRQTWDIEETDNHKVERLIGTVQDITEEKQSALDILNKAEVIERQNEGLAKRHAQIQAILNSSKDPMYFMNILLEYADVNTAFLELLGKTQQDVIGRSSHDILPVDWAQQIKIEDEHVITKKLSIKREEWIESAANTGARLFEVRKDPVLGQDGSVIGVFSVYHDVTDRDEAQKEILRLNEDLEMRVLERTKEVQRSRQQYLAILNNVPQYLLLLSASGNIIDANRSILDTLEADIQDVCGRPVWDLGAWASPRRVRESLKDELAHIKPGVPANLQLSIKHSGGRHEILDVNLEAVQGIDGGVAFVTLSAHDITELKTTQTFLSAARHAAETANRSKSSFLAKMSHEIRTPMNGIMGSVDLLKSATLSHQERDLLDLISRSTHGLLQVINDILDFSKIEAGKVRLEEIPFSANQVVEDVVLTLQPDAQKKGVTQQLYIDPQIPSSLIGDPSRVRQVLVNLVSNAIKFTLPREKKEAEVRIRADLIKSDGSIARVRYSVADTGGGIPEAARDSLFSAFSQADSSITRKFGGSGLGLAICNQLTELMHGQIHFESEVDRGSTFSFEIPHMIDTDNESCEEEDLLDGRSVFISIDNQEVEGTVIDYITALGASVEKAPERQAGNPRSVEYSNLIDSADLAIVDARAARKEFSGLIADSAGRQCQFLAIATDSTLPQQDADCPCSVLPGKPLLPSHLRKVLTSFVSEGKVAELPCLESVEKTGDDGPPLAGFSVLLAEDDEINQMVISRQLSALGTNVEIANDGLEALKKLEAGNYDILITDWHMPELDGLALIGRIRAEEGETGEHLPIITLSAHAVTGAAGECLAAGADYYISKPIETAKLRQVLEKALHTKNRAGKLSAQILKEPPEPSSYDNTPIIDISRLSDFLGEDHEVQLETMKSFQEMATQNIDMIRQLVGSAECDEIAELVHAMKSAARLICADTLGQACEDLELCCREGHTDKVEMLFKIIHGAFLDVVQEIEVLPEKLRHIA